MRWIFGPLDAFHTNGIGRRSHNSSVFLTREACDFQVSVRFGVMAFGNDPAVLAHSGLVRLNFRFAFATFDSSLCGSRVIYCRRVTHPE